jgi:integrase
MSKTKEYTFEAVNQRLKVAGRQVSLYLRGSGRISVLGTFPPKPGSDRPFPYQQKIGLGLPANEDGYRRAEAEAIRIGRELIDGDFRWEKYMKPDRLPEGKPVARWVEEFEAYYRGKVALTDERWSHEWGVIFRRLPQTVPLTPEVLKTLVFKSVPDSHTRKKTCQKLQHLAKFAKIDIDLLEFKGTYGASKVKPRDIPQDDAIALWWEKIPNPQWQWVYGIMAAFGLRDHEVFFCEWADDGLQVTKGKTGPRLVYLPLFPEWVEQWDLRTIKLPHIKDIGKLYDQTRLGEKVARQFRRYGVPFAPYDLRHAYAIRASVTFGLDVVTAAALMGHTPKMHLDRYQKHIDLKTNQRAAQKIMERSDRPQPPRLPGV